MGGRYTISTNQYLLEQGHQVGLVASKDDHLGYPGAYGEGLVAVYKDTLIRPGTIQLNKKLGELAASSDQHDNETTDCYYVRVTQTNGSLVWSSPTPGRTQ